VPNRMRQSSYFIRPESSDAFTNAGYDHDFTTAVL